MAEELAVMQAELVRAQEERRFQDALCRVLVRPSEPLEMLREVLGLLVPCHGDWGVADLLDGDHHTTRLFRHRRGLSGDAILRPPAVTLDPLWKSLYVAREGHARLYPVTSPPRFAPGVSDARLQPLHHFGLCSVLIVPLAACGMRLGALTLVRDEDRSPYSPESVPPLERAAAGVALALAARSPKRP